MFFSNSLRNQSKVPVLFSKDPARAKLIWVVELWMQRILFLTLRITNCCCGRRLEDPWLAC